MSALRKRLEERAQKGLTSDVPRLLHLVVAQDGNPHSCFRELCTNACDAGADHCSLHLRALEDGCELTVSDNGSGMSYEVLTKRFFGLFNSFKGDKDLGEFGVGKTSIGRLPGQYALRVETSTGEEYSTAATGRIEDSAPVECTTEKRDAGWRGTVLKIAYRPEGSLKSEAEAFARVARDSCGRLPIRIMLSYALEAEEGEMADSELSRLIYDREGSWLDEGKRFQVEGELQLEGEKARVVVCPGTGRQELYKQQVLVSSSQSDLNLAAADCEEKLLLACLDIRVDCKAFKLPLGRHRITNPELLAELAPHVRRVIVELLRRIEQERVQANLQQTGITADAFDQLLVSLLGYSRRAGLYWCSLPIVRMHNGERISYNELRERVESTELLYLADGAANLDTALLHGPVLAQQQSTGLLKLLQEDFEENLHVLSRRDVLIKDRSAEGTTLSDEEQQLQRYLMLRKAPVGWLQREQAEEVESAPPSGYRPVHHEMVAEHRAAALLRRQRIELGHLINQDGSAASERFYKTEMQAGRIVLNLHHPQVRALVRFASLDPDLAANFALSLLLMQAEDELQEIPADKRDDWLLEDIIARLVDPRPTGGERQLHSHSEAFLEFLRRSGRGDGRKGA